MKPNVQQLRSLPDFVQLFQWNISVVRQPKVATFPNDLNLRAVSVDKPKAAPAMIEVSVRGHKIKQPGISTTGGTITLTLLETVDMKVTNFIRDLREAQFEQGTGIQAPRSDVDFDLKLEQLDRQNEPIWGYILIGCIIEDYDTGGQLADQASDIVKPTMTIGYTWFVEGPPDSLQVPSLPDGPLGT